jgi:predicted RNA-binding Zn-ribbon protein involved in translation (DUF1610 family)
MEEEIDFDEDTEVELISCKSCEAEFKILLGEDLLNEDAHYCPFCGEPDIVEA